MAWRTSARYGTKQKRLDLADTWQKRVTQCSDPICLSACLFVWLCYMCARACVCGFSLCSSFACVRGCATWQYPEIAATCLSGMADIECACGIGIGHGCGKTLSCSILFL